MLMSSAPEHKKNKAKSYPSKTKANEVNETEFSSCPDTQKIQVDLEWNTQDISKFYLVSKHFLFHLNFFLEKLRSALGPVVRKRFNLIQD